MPPVRRLRFETLESRQLLAVDLTVDDVEFVDPTDPFGSPTSEPVTGQKIALRAEINFSGLADTDVYELKFDINGVAIDVVDAQATAGQNITHFWVRDGWIARPGIEHVITVTVDPEDKFAEMDETNNAFAFSFSPENPNLSQKFLKPLVGEENVDWIVNGLVDVDPAFCFECAEDYLGNKTITRDFHNGIDFGLINFAQADQGVAVQAVADGTVTLVQDGNFDRWRAFQDPIPAGNRVFVDHGDGWVTQYYHLQSGSVSVEVGDPVIAGQVIGMVGSSGNSAGPHLHFEVQRHHLPVEPFLAPNEYFLDPPAYPYDVDPLWHDLGITTAFPHFRDIIELPSDNDALPAQSVSLSPWAVFSSIEPGDTWQMKFYRPDGTEYVQPAFAVPIPFADDIRGSWQWNRWWNVFLENPEAGNWRAEVLANGTVVGSEEFIIGRTLPELRLIEDTNSNGSIEFDEPLLIDGRKTPLDFGSAQQGDTNPAKQLLLENHGFADLEITSIQLPTGFVLSEPLDATIAAGTLDSFTLALDTTSVGAKSGTIELITNDRAASDLDADGDVDGADFLSWQRGFGTSDGATPEDGDINGNGTTGSDDFAVWQREYGRWTETLFEFQVSGTVVAAIGELNSPKALVVDVIPLSQRWRAADEKSEQQLFEPTLHDAVQRQRLADTLITRVSQRGTSTHVAVSVENQADKTLDSFDRDAVFELLGFLDTLQ